MLDKLLLNILKGSLARWGVGRHAWHSRHTDGDSTVVMLLNKKAKSHLHKQKV
jgi:hypothetical protein